MGEPSVASGFITGFGQAVLQFAFESLRIIGAVAGREIRLILEFEDQLRQLHRTSLKIQDLVDHVDSSTLRFSGGSKAWQVCFEDLQKLSYDANALLDHVILHLSVYRGKHSADARQGSQFLTMFFGSGEYTVPHKVEKMREKLEGLAEEVKSLFHIQQVKRDIDTCKTMERSCCHPDNSDNSSLLVDEQTIVGRQQDKEEVNRLLCENDDALSVISLVGMAGIGKTTLAQLVFSEARREDYELKIWVPVSMDFDVRRITKSIIESATKKPCHISELGSLQHELQQILSTSGKLLLVLDDYWNENLDDWDLLSAPLKSASIRSKVIVTTRSNIVSTVVGSVKAYAVQALTDDDCWNLMKQRAWLQNEENRCLESLGRKIAKKCKGLPLAAKVLGSVLHRKSTNYEWLCNTDSKLLDLPQDKNGIFPSLMRSYHHLPAHLQKCFTYCSIFPQNHEFEVEELVLLWMAEGFIQPQGERKLEDIGNDYFNDLQMRSFFQQGTNSSNSTTYKMHDLIHDFARLVSTNTRCEVIVDIQHSYQLFGDACHLSLHHQTGQALQLKESLKNARLRTFMVACNPGAREGQVDRRLFNNLKFLRVLYLCDIGLKELPDSVDRLTSLRYLNLCRNRIESLPRSICELLALETLMLFKCSIVTLPRDMKNLSKLRHLMFDVESRLRSLPPDFGKLTNLQTLSAFIVGNTNGHGIEELEKMDSLRGTLCIKNIDKVLEELDASNAKMKEKKYLNKLELKWGETVHGNEMAAMEQQVLVLEKLEPHENLKELEIINYSGTRCPNWLSDRRHKFTGIHLHGLSHCTALPSLGQLPFLKFLLIAEMDALEGVDQTFYGNGNDEKFPSLECLKVYQMPKLVRWMLPSGSSICMRCLTDFKIEGCEKLICPPTESTLKITHIHA